VGIGERARASVDGDGLVLEPAGEADRPGAVTPPPLPDAAKPSAPVAELRAVSRHFRQGMATRIVLDDLHAGFLPGRLTLVVGRSGSGKSTLLNLLAGLDRPTHGDVLLLGNSIARLSRTDLALVRRAHVGLVGQEPGLVPFLSALENVAFGLQLRGAAGHVEETALAALTEMGLEQRVRQRVDRLSAGERQRVAVARALAHGPRILLADEPTARLDEENARLTADLLLRAARSRDAAVVCATHDPALLALADDVIRLEPG
jgi:putative ABC transport system ATP-binding protein